MYCNHDALAAYQQTANLFMAALLFAAYVLKNLSVMKYRLYGQLYLKIKTWRIFNENE